MDILNNYINNILYYNILSSIYNYLFKIIEFLIYKITYSENLDNIIRKYSLIYNRFDGINEKPDNGMYILCINFGKGNNLVLCEIFKNHNRYPAENNYILYTFNYEVIQFIKEQYQSSKSNTKLITLYNYTKNKYGETISNKTNIYSSVQDLYLKQKEVLDYVNKNINEAMNISVLLCGQKNTGKSETAKILVKNLLKSNEIVNLNVYDNIFDTRIISKVNEINVILIDEIDILFEENSKDKICKALDILNSLENVIVVATSNLSKSEIMKKYDIYTRKGRFTEIFQF